MSGDKSESEEPHTSQRGHACIVEGQIHCGGPGVSYTIMMRLAHAMAGTVLAGRLPPSGSAVRAVITHPYQPP